MWLILNKSFILELGQNMIFDKYISFDEIIGILENLEKEINEI